MEFLGSGQKLHRCRTHFLSELRFARRILILGEGYGRFLADCCRTNPEAQITVVDASQRMLALAQERLHRNGLSADNITFIHADALEWNTSERFDAVVTLFFLDCFRREQLEQLIPKLASLANAEATWLISDFREPPSGFRRLRARLILWSLYTFFRITTGIAADRIVPPDSLLEASGFRLHQRHLTDWDLLYSDCWKRVI
mgnify:CR=1 FL=1|jgi:16S RNA G1207 methylase RsmC